jgi:hypothetical protein
MPKESSCYAKNLPYDLAYFLDDAEGSCDLTDSEECFVRDMQDRLAIYGDITFITEGDARMLGKIRRKLE